MLNGCLWILRTGARWKDLPHRYPSHQTCHRRCQQWVRSGVLRGLLEALSLDLEARGQLNLREAVIEGVFAPAKKGGCRCGQNQAGQGDQDQGSGRRLQSSYRLGTASASPPEVTLMAATLAESLTSRWSLRVRHTRCRLGPARCRDDCTSPA